MSKSNAAVYATVDPREFTFLKERSDRLHIPHNQIVAALLRHLSRIPDAEVFAMVATPLADEDTGDTTTIE